jgi:hypothetical protein
VIKLAGAFPLLQRQRQQRNSARSTYRRAAFLTAGQHDVLVSWCRRALVHPTTRDVHVCVAVAGGYPPNERVARASPGNHAPVQRCRSCATAGEEDGCILQYGRGGRMMMTVVPHRNRRRTRARLGCRYACACRCREAAARLHECPRLPSTASTSGWHRNAGDACRLGSVARAGSSRRPASAWIAVRCSARAVVARVLSPSSFSRVRSERIPSRDGRIQRSSRLQRRGPPQRLNSLVR